MGSSTRRSDDAAQGPVEYDPYSHEAMSDPAELYRQMRAEGCPHFIEKYRTWALTRYEDVERASLAEDHLDFTHGALLGQLVLGEPIPRSFMTMNAPEHRKWRAILNPFYSAKAANEDRERVRALVHELLAPWLPQGRLDVYRDLANRVMCINAGHALGLPRDDAEHIRFLIDEMIMHREPGQRGMTSARNQAAAQELGGYLAAYVARLRANPAGAKRIAKALLEAEVDGERLDDGALIAYFFSLLVTGSETTPMAIAGAFYYLGKHPEQKALVLADPALAKAAFLETCRYDQPTNMLGRRIGRDLTLGDKVLRAGDNVMMIYASANRDEAQFENADRFDIRRPPQRDLSFGVGGHFCLGAHLARMVGPLVIEEVLGAIGDYDLVEDQCERAYGENLAGFTRVPIRFRPRV